MQKNKSFFDLDTGLAEIELPAEYRSHFIRWSKKIEKQDKFFEKLKASIEIKNNEYFLIFEEEDQKQYRMNISDLSKPANKNNLLIPSPSFIEQNDQSKPITLLTYKAIAKFDNGNQREVDELSRGIKNLIKPIKGKKSSNSDLSESESDLFRPPEPLNLSHINKTQPPPKNIQQYQEYDKQTLKENLIDLLRPKGAVGLTIYEIKQHSNFCNVSEKQLKDVLKSITSETKKSSRVYFILLSTLI